MGRRVHKGGCVHGGILSLVRIIRDHDRALEYDLMTRTGRTLSEYAEMGAAGKVALLSFINYLPPDSRLREAMDPQDETDVFVSANTKKGRKAKQYPRPKQKKRIGSGAIPIRDFWSWWNGGE